MKRTLLLIGLIFLTFSVCSAGMFQTSKPEERLVTNEPVSYDGIVEEVVSIIENFSSEGFSLDGEGSSRSRGFFKYTIEKEYITRNSKDKISVAFNIVKFKSFDRYVVKITTLHKGRKDTGKSTGKKTIEFKTSDREKLEKQLRASLKLME